MDIFPCGFFGTFIVFHTLADKYGPNLLKHYVQNWIIIIHMLALQLVSPMVTLQETVCYSKKDFSHKEPSQKNFSKNYFQKIRVKYLYIYMYIYICLYNLAHSRLCVNYGL